MSRPVDFGSKKVRINPDLVRHYSSDSSQSPVRRDGRNEASSSKRPINNEEPRNRYSRNHQKYNEEFDSENDDSGDSRRQGGKIDRLENSFSMQHIPRSSNRRQRFMPVIGDTIIHKNLTRTYVFYRPAFDWYDTEQSVVLDDYEEVLPPKQMENLDFDQMSRSNRRDDGFEIEEEEEYEEYEGRRGNSRSRHGSMRHERQSSEKRRSNNPDLVLKEKDISTVKRTSELMTKEEYERRKDGKEVVSEVKISTRKPALRQQSSYDNNDNVVGRMLRDMKELVIREKNLPRSQYA